MNSILECIDGEPHCLHWIEGDSACCRCGLEVEEDENGTVDVGDVPEEYLKRAYNRAGYAYPFDEEAP